MSYGTIFLNRSTSNVEMVASAERVNTFKKMKGSQKSIGIVDLIYPRYAQ